MSTTALVGLLVVVLVAIGIAGFLVRGRRGARRTDPSRPPRTVGELVDRRRSGLDDPHSGADSDHVADVDDDADTAAIEEQGGSGTTTTVSGTTTTASDAPTPSGSTAPDAGSAPAGGSSDRPGTAAAATGATVVAGGTAATVAGRHYARGADATDETGPAVSGTDADEATSPDPAAASTTRDASPTTGSPGDAGSAGPTPSPRPRPGSDADTGPASAPWSRGFVGGRQVTPPPPEATGTSTPAAGSPAASSSSTSSASSTSSVSGTAESTGSSATGDAPRPSAPPRQQSQSPVDPDLVKRVTAVPSTGGRRTDDPDTEREFREARDRMAGAAGSRPGRVPEQSSRSPEAAASAGATESSAATPSPSSTPPRPSPSPRATREQGSGAGVAAAGAAGVAVTASVPASRSTPGGADDSRGEGDSRDEGSVDDPAHAGRPEQTSTGATARPSPGPRSASGGGTAAGDEPPPRPTPRVMRSATPGGPDDVDSRADEQVSSGAGATGAGPGDGDATAPATSPSAGEPTPAAATGSDAGGTGVRTSAVAEPAPVVAFSAPSASRREPLPTSPAQDVDVQVTDREARPLSAVSLSMVDGSGAPAGSASTGAAGDARLRAPGAGRYVVVAAAPGYQTRVTPCAVADEPVRVAVTLARSSAVHGAVRSASGVPRSGVPVVLEQDGETVGRADTGDDGTFRFADLDAGHYRIVADDDPGRTVHVRPGADVEQDLGGTAGVTAAATATRDRA